MRHTTIIMLLLASAMGIASTTMARAQGDIRQQLWVERNSIYKDRGYCFKTQRGIAYFGNAGCMYDREGDIPMSAAERRRISEIIAEERANGCR